MSVFITGTGLISPQDTFGHSLEDRETVVSVGSRFNCIEPEYNTWIDPRAIRRMSRIIRMGVASSFAALREAGVEKPDAIITGTALGCLADTGIFLSKMIENHEQALNPTPFIQSTHNTIGSQIALLLKCHGYNQTFTQSGFSFENALLDAIMMLVEYPDRSVLVGGIDEVTDTSFAILKRFGLFREGGGWGEGSSFFVLKKHADKNTYAGISGVNTFYQPNEKKLSSGLQQFLEGHKISLGEIDLLLYGKSRLPRFDTMGDRVVQKLFAHHKIGTFKNLCGEYPTASGFAVGLAAQMLRDQFIPQGLKIQQGAKKEGELRNILIYNPYFGTHHSLILLQRVEI